MIIDDVKVKAVTEKALLIELSGDDEVEEVWIPKSQLGDETDVADVGDVGQVEIPDWLAAKRDLGKYAR